VTTYMVDMVLGCEIYEFLKLAVFSKGTSNVWAGALLSEEVKLPKTTKDVISHFCILSDRNLCAGSSCTPPKIQAVVSF
jgi:hypothetical protein